MKLDFMAKEKQELWFLPSSNSWIFKWVLKLEMIFRLPNDELGYTTGKRAEHFGNAFLESNRNLYHWILYKFSYDVFT